MARKNLISLHVGLLAGTAMRLSPMEQRAGRFLRSGDGHMGTPAPAQAAEPAAAPAEAPAAKPAPRDAMDALELEMGSVVLPGNEPVEEEPAKADSGVAGEKPKEEPAATLETEKQRADAAEKALADFKAAQSKDPAKDDAKPATQEPEDPAPKSDDYEFGEADSKFIADWASWNARQAFRQERAKEVLKTELDTIESGWKTNATNEEVLAEYPDFDEVVNQGATNQAWECSPLMALAIKASAEGPHVAYELAKDPAEATRIAKLIPVEQAFEMGKKIGQQAARLASKKTPAPEPKPVAKVASSAPPPPTNRSRGSGGQYETEMNTMQDRMLKEFR